MSSDVEGVLLRHDAEPGADARPVGARVEAQHPQRAVGDRRDAADHAHRRGLAGAVGTEEAEGLAAVHVDVDAVDGGEVTEALHQPAGVDQRQIFGLGGHVIHPRSTPRQRPPHFRCEDQQRQDDLGPGTEVGSAGRTRRSACPTHHSRWWRDPAVGAASKNGPVTAHDGPATRSPASRPPPGRGSRGPSRRRHPPRRGPGRRSRGATTRWSWHRPARARRWPRSCGRSTGWPAHRAPSRPSAAAASSTSRR